MFEALSHRFIFIVFLGSVLSICVAGQKLSFVADKSDASHSSTDPAVSSVRPTLIGVYSPDGSFHETHASRQKADSSRVQTVQAAVPPAFQLHSNEHVVENFVPPMHATRPVRGHSPLGLLFDGFLTFAYGREIVLRQPTKMTTDSRGQLIVADPKLAAVHILDAANEGSFRISGGPSRRFEVPNDVAVDGNDNIYVADHGQARISVFAPDGHFLYYLGRVRGESLFAATTAIAIDNRKHHLYVVDAIVGELVMLDLSGNVLKRIGNTRSELRLERPTEVAVWKDEVVVLSRQGSHADILDSDGNPQSSFEIVGTPEMPSNGWIALAIDQHANIYVSNMMSASVRVYSPDGRFITALEKPSVINAMGLWVDSSNRLFVADSTGGEVHVFRIGPAFGPPPAAAR